MGNKKAVLYYKCRSQQKSRTAKMLTGMRQKSQQTSRTTKMLTGMRGKSQQTIRTTKMLTGMRRKSQQNNRPVTNADFIAINYTFQNRGKK